MKPKPKDFPTWFDVFKHVGTQHWKKWKAKGKFRLIPIARALQYNYRRQIKE